MKPIDELRKHIKRKHPQAGLTVTPPLNKEGVWFIEIADDHKQLVIEWSLATGFGISAVDATHGYGERPDESYTSLDDIKQRVTELLVSDGITSPPIGVLLARIREQQGYTQEQLASKLGVRQATVSGMEGRNDIQVSTLRRVVNALSGSLEMYAVFSRTRYRLAPPSAEAAADMTIENGKASAPVSAISAFDYDATFGALRERGELSRARKVAADIRSRGAVLEMAD